MSNQDGTEENPVKTQDWEELGGAEYETWLDNFDIDDDDMYVCWKTTTSKLTEADPCKWTVLGNEFSLTKRTTISRPRSARMVGPGDIPS